jgi:DNA repair protein RadC
MNNGNFQVAEITLCYRTKVKAADRPQINSSFDAFSLFTRQWSDLIEFQEEFNILLINRANRVLGIFNASKGSSCGTVVDPKLIFAAAIKGNASAIILAHNHPSGNKQPSQQDIDITKRLTKAGEILDINVLDHLILTPEDGYFSFADEGMI